MQVHRLLNSRSRGSRSFRDGAGDYDTNLSEEENRLLTFTTMSSSLAACRSRRVRKRAVGTKPSSRGRQERRRLAGRTGLDPRPPFRE